MNLRYNTQPENDRYDYISEIGYMPNYKHELTDEPFDMETAMYFRWDKDSRGWVTGILQIIGWVVTIVAGIISIAMMWERRRFYRREHQLRHQNRFKYTGKTHNYGS